MPRSEMVQSVLKALDLFRILAESDTPLHLVDLARRADLRPTTAYNLLRTLRARGFVIQDDSGNYCAGTVMEELHGQIFHKRVLALGTELVRKVTDKYPKLIVTFSELTHSAVICRIRMSPERPGELQRPREMTFPPYAMVTSRCLQALAAHGEIFEAFHPFEEFGSRCPLSQAQFVKERAKIRKDGYCMQTEGRSGRNTLAIYIPDNYALGLSSDAGQKLPLQETLKMVRQFREKLSAEPEKE